MSIKNIPVPEKGKSCSYCAQEIFEFTTPGGGDCCSCPICGSPCPCAYASSEDDLDCSNFIEINNDEWEHFCSKCRILFDAGCIHAVNGCTEDTNWGALVTSYTYKGETYQGMPQFESLEHVVKVKKDLKLTWECMCKKGQKKCPHAFYPYKKYPQNYRGETSEYCCKGR